MRTLLLLSAAVVCATSVLAQEPQFEVASIKPSPEGRAGRFMLQPGGRLTVTGWTARTLIERAHGLQPYQLEGLPPWASQDKFEIQAKAAEREQPFGSAEVLAMLRQLLTERFGLQTHRESRVRPVFLMTREHPDRPLSQNFHPSTVDCIGRRPADLGPTPGGSCGIVSRASDTAVTLIYQGRTLAEFANELVRRAGRPVIDRTNIEGQYDIEVATDRGGDQFTPLREQLGLRLTGSEAPIEMLIVDAIQRPTPD